MKQQKQYFITHNFDESEVGKKKLHISAVFMTGVQARTIDRVMRNARKKISSEHNVNLEILGSASMPSTPLHEKGGRVMSFTHTYLIKD